MSSLDSPGNQVVFRPERTNLLAAALMTAILLLVIGAKPLMLVWTLLIPAAFVYWILKASTTVNEEGLKISYAFRSGQAISWEELQGVGFKGARTLATTTTGKEYPLPGVSFNSLPELSQASRGRIPDVLTAGRDAANDKVMIITKNGEEILVTKEEYAARMQQNKEH